MQASYSITLQPLFPKANAEYPHHQTLYQSSATDCARCTQNSMKVNACSHWHFKIQTGRQNVKA